MSKLEDGYFYSDSSGNVRFFSYDSLGGGGAFFALIIFATIFIRTIGNFLIDNQWLVVFPGLISVIINYVMYYRELSIKQKICNMIADIVRTTGFYGILIALFAKILSCHVLDRIFVALGLGLLFAGAYVLINIVCKFFKKMGWSIAHLIASIVAFLISLRIYMGQVKNGNIQFNKPAPVQPTTSVIPHYELLYGLDTTAEFVSSLTPILTILFTGLFIVATIVIAKTVKKKIDKSIQSKFDPISVELKKFLPNNADEYNVSKDGISFLIDDKYHHITYNEFGYESFSTKSDTEIWYYINNMGAWIMKNIVADAKKYKTEAGQTPLKDRYFRIQSIDYIRRNTLKKW